MPLIALAMMVSGSASQRADSISDVTFQWLAQPEGGRYAVPTTISNDGKRVYGMVHDGLGSAARVCRWDEGRPQLLPVPQGAKIVGGGVCASGNGRFVAASVAFEEADRACVWDEGIPRIIPLLEGADSMRPVAVAANGRVVGEARWPSGGGTWRWDGRMLRAVPPLPGATDSVPVGISADGSTVVGEAPQKQSGPNYAWIWTLGGKTRALPTNCAQTVIVGGVSADGASVLVIENPYREKGAAAFLWRADAPRRSLDLDTRSGEMLTVGALDASGTLALVRGSMIANGESFWLLTHAQGVRDLGPMLKAFLSGRPGEASPDPTDILTIPAVARLSRKRAALVGCLYDRTPFRMEVPL